MKDLEYLELLAEQYPNKVSVSSEIINLKAIINLPKGTEHFLTDIHGEYESFKHMLKTASGVLKFKIDDIFAEQLNSKQKEKLIALISYPEEKLKLLKNQGVLCKEWYQKILFRIIKICKVVSSKYSRSKVRKALPENFSYIIEELLHLKSGELNRKDYYNQIIDTIIQIEQADNFIITLSNLIQSLMIDKLHIIGDIFDRGSKPHKIVDELKEYHDCDIQWGNHDILWMGAALGQRALIATVIRVSLRYGNLKLLEEGYGINMRHLARFAMSVYGDSDCSKFSPKLDNQNIDINDKDKKMIAQMHKAITIIQLKLEGDMINRRFKKQMNEELYLEMIDYEKGLLNLHGKQYELSDDYFPTIDPENPYQLTEEEQEVIEHLSYSFKTNEKLQEHVRFLFNKGSMYLKYNGNLLIHGCIPMEEDGSFAQFELDGETYKGKALLDFFDEAVKKSYTYQFEEQDYRDLLWYLWRGRLSPLFGKDKMTTFFRYFTNDESLYKEQKNPYYTLREDEAVCLKILREFDLDFKRAHIINGHTPVEEKSGESPIKGGGRLLVIDGGMSDYYQPKTGIAGYTLIYNSYGLRLISHKPFVSLEKAIKEGDNIVSSVRVVEKSERQKIAATDKGRELSSRISDLMDLLESYKKGMIKERELT